MPISNPATIDTILATNLQSDMPLMLPGGRLTLVRADSAAGGTNQTQCFYVPHLHPYIPILNPQTGLWSYFKLPANGVIALNAPNAGGHLDIFASGTLATGFEVTAQGWTSTAARFIPLVLNGLQCGDFGVASNPRYKTYLGTVKTTGTGSNGLLNDNYQFRHLWNAYNRVERPVSVIEAANSWDTNTAVYRPLNNNANNRVEMLAGLPGQKVDIEGRFSAYTVAGRAAVFAQFFNGAYDGATQVVIALNGSGETSATNRLLNRAVVGLNTVSAYEIVSGGANVTIYGYSRNGLRGFWDC